MKILVMGGDSRMQYTAKKLSADTLFLGESPAISEKTGGKYDAIILPMPLSRDGKSVPCPLSETSFEFAEIIGFTNENARIFAGGYSAELAEICQKNGLTLENYSESEALTLKNAKLTAEAAVMLLIQSSRGALLGSTVLITGYGRIARFLAEALAVFGSKIIIAARKSEARVSAELAGFSGISIEEIPAVIGECDYIANTVPAEIFSENDFSKMKPETVFTELATLPSEPAKSLCEKYGVKYVFAGGLPGKYSPKSAGEFIAGEIERRLTLNII